jgi:DNA modification methylase
VILKTLDVMKMIDNAISQERDFNYAFDSNKPFGFYWTRKDINLGSRLISSFLPEGGLVLDPFFGSGSTGYSVLNLGDSYKSIGIELNEMPVEIYKFNNELKEAWKRKKELEEILNLLDSWDSSFTFDGASNGPCTVQRFYFDKEERELRLVAADLHSASNGTTIHASDSENTELFEIIRRRRDDLIFSLAKVSEDSLVLDENSRIAIKSGAAAKDFFDPLSYGILRAIRATLPSSTTLQILLAGVLHLARLSDRKSQSQFPYWFPSVDAVSKNPIKILRKGANQMSSRINFLETCDLNSLSKATVFQGDARHEIGQNLKKESVDLVLTDPPYFDQVAYSEYLKLWEDVTGFRSFIGNEIVQSNRKGGTQNREKFLADLTEAFVCVHQSLKKRGIAIVYFKDSKFNNLADFLRVMVNAGFELAVVRHIEKPAYTYKQNASKLGTVAGDAIYVFRKSEVSNKVQNFGTIHREDTETYIKRVFGEYLKLSGPSTLTRALDDKLIKQMFDDNRLEELGTALKLQRILSKHYEYDTSTRTWNLP